MYVPYMGYVAAFLIEKKSLFIFIVDHFSYTKYFLHKACGWVPLIEGYGIEAMVYRNGALSGVCSRMSY